LIEDPFSNLNVIGYSSIGNDFKIAGKETRFPAARIQIAGQMAGKYWEFS